MSIRVARSLIALACLVVVTFGMTGCVVGRRGDTASLPTADGPALTYIVVAGDTLSSVANRHQISVDAIIAANELHGINLTPGQKLRLPGARPLPPAIPTTVEKPVAPATTAYAIPRARWATQEIDRSNIDPMSAKPYRITVHHSGDCQLPNGMRETGDPVEVLRFIERAHKIGAGKNMAFACIGYHFLISTDGRVWEGRPLQYQGAHAGDNEKNQGNIGICLLGNFDRDSVPAVQRQALTALLDRLTADFQIPRGQVFGHCNFKDTDCPGTNLKPIVAAYSGHPIVYRSVVYRR